MAARKTKAKRQPAGGGGSRAASLRAPALPRPFSEFLGVALLAVGVLMLGGLLSYQTGSGTLMGPVGQLAATALYASFGMAAYLITLGVLGVGVKALLGQGMEITLGEGVGFSVATVAGCVLLHVMFPEYRVHGYTAGGLAGELAGEVSLGLFHHAGTYLVAVTLLCVGLIASTPLSAVHLIAMGRWIGRGASSVGDYLWTGVVQLIKTQRDPGPVEADADASLDEDEDAAAPHAGDELDDDELDDDELEDELDDDLDDEDDEEDDDEDEDDADDLVDLDEDEDLEEDDEDEDDVDDE
jgi:hypothetical protein